MNVSLWIIRAWCLLAILSSTWGCSNSNKNSFHFDSLLFSKQVQEWLKNVVPSVVGVSTIFSYQIETYNHQIVNGIFISDSTSPTGYLLKPTKSEIREENERVNGSGLIIYRDDVKAVILTNAHLVTRKDTIDTYYRNRDGSFTNVLFSRAQQKTITHHAIGQVNQFVQAEIIAADTQSDLALLLVPASLSLGIPFPFGLAHKEPLKWGDFVYAFGNPRQTKQVSSGLVSLTAHEGVFVINVVARSGFSGGPVFVIRSEQGLEFAGVISGVPADKFNYVAPPENIVPGQFIDNNDLPNLSAQQINLIQYGTTYAVGLDLIKSFLKENSKELQRRAIILSSKYFPD